MGGGVFNQLRIFSLSCGDAELWSQHTHRNKGEVFLVITEKEKEKTLIIMCLHLKNDSRINNTSKMTLRCKVPSLGTSLGHNTIEFSASTLIAVSTILKQTNVLAKRDFLGMYSM